MRFNPLRASAIRLRLINQRGDSTRVKKAMMTGRTGRMGNKVDQVHQSKKVTNLARGRRHGRERASRERNRRVPRSTWFQCRKWLSWSRLTTCVAAPSTAPARMYNTRRTLPRWRCPLEIARLIIWFVPSWCRREKRGMDMGVFPRSTLCHVETKRR